MLFNSFEESWKERFTYDPDTGEIKNKHGKVLGYKNPRGYIRIRVAKGKQVPAHRLAWFLQTGEDPGDMVIDHINRDPSDNRWENLRLVTQGVNQSNSNALGYYFDKNRKSPYQVKLSHEGRIVLSRHFACPLLARIAYVEAVEEFKGIKIGLTACF